MKIFICVGSSCHLKGSYEVINAFKRNIEEHKLSDKIELRASFCLGKCSDDGVCVKVNDDLYNLTVKDVDLFFENIIQGLL